MGWSLRIRLPVRTLHKTRSRMRRWVTYLSASTACSSGRTTQNPAEGRDNPPDATWRSTNQAPSHPRSLEASDPASREGHQTDARRRRVVEAATCDSTILCSWIDIYMSKISPPYDGNVKRSALRMGCRELVDIPVGRIIVSPKSDRMHRRTHS